jgi:hypothetical protein
VSGELAFVTGVLTFDLQTVNPLVTKKPVVGRVRPSDRLREPASREFTFEPAGLQTGC